MALKRVAVLTSPRGLRGELSLISYVSDYLSLKDYSPLTDLKEEEFHITHVRLQGKRLIANVKDINSRTEAEKIRNTTLFTDEGKFPKLSSDEFIPSHLIDMQVLLEDKTEYGFITNCYNFGAGEIVEINLANSSKTILLPLNKECFPVIDKNNKVAIVILPEII